MSDIKIKKTDEKHRDLEIVVSSDEVNKALERARVLVTELSKRPLGSKQLGADPEQTKENAVRVRATREIAEGAIRKAVEEYNLRLASNPKSELEELVEQDKPYSFTVAVEVVPEFELEEFDKLTVSYDANLTVSDEEVDQRLEEIRSRSASVEKDSSAPISDNDIVDISFESFIDGEAYEGSTAKGYAYTMGSLYLPADFEAGLMGLKAGDSASIEFVVPEDYGNDDIAGKKARFDVTINRVASCTLPDVDDTFAKDFGYESLGAWKEKIHGELKAQKEGEIEERKEKSARELLASKLLGRPDASMIDAAVERMFQAFKTDLKQQGIDFVEYCRFLNLTEKSVKEEMREEAQGMLLENLALESLFRKQGMKINDTELNKTVAQLAEDSGMPQSVSFLEFNKEQQDAIREMTMHRMATEWLLENSEFISE